MRKRATAAWIAAFVMMVAFVVLAIFYQFKPTEEIVHMDCAGWPPWEQRSVAEEMDPRERAVITELTMSNSLTPEVCEQYRYVKSISLVRSTHSLAEITSYFLHQMSGAGQCMALDGSYWFDMGGWNYEAIQSVTMLASRLEDGQ